MLKNLKFILPAALACVLLFSCAKEDDESNNSIQKRILDAYLEVNYPNKNYTVTESGLVILNHEDGRGDGPELYGAAYTNYSIRTLDGNYQATTMEDVARKIGAYSDTAYYGPKIMEIGYGNIVKGVHEALMKMNKGARMTVIIPPHLSVRDYPENLGSGYTANNAETSSQNLIYDLVMGDVIYNLQKFQRDSLESFKNYRYPGLDSIADGYYFKKLSGTSTDTIPKDDEANVWYVGKLLDGHVFDTNIADTAKKYRIYDASKDYAPLEVRYESTYNLMSSDGGGSYVTGFARALKSMTYGDRAVTFFSYDWGYNNTSTGGIPAYSMLFFDIYIEETAAE